MKPENEAKIRSMCTGRTEAEIKEIITSIDQEAENRALQQIIKQAIASHQHDPMKDCAITREGCHEWIKTLQNLLEENAGAAWAVDWIDMLSYLCSCTECRQRMKEVTLDTKMLDKIFGLDKS